MEQIACELRSKLGEQLTVRIHYFDQIPLTPSGKHRVTISELA